MSGARRRGARSIQEIPAEVLEQLNRGELETANLVEWLAVDQRALLERLLVDAGRAGYVEPILRGVERLKKQTVNTLNEAIGAGLLEQSLGHEDAGLLPLVAAHGSDVVRCWATYAVGRDARLSTREKLSRLQPFAADRHFGVREVSWLSVRPSLAADLEEGLEVLSGWVTDPDENVRRFASEATRPRGVWCEHLEALKRDPERGLVILEPLRSDPARYVQDSVGNWLNDASKSRPEFVRALCARWSEESPTRETAYLVKKALRTVDK